MKPFKIARITLFCDATLSRLVLTNFKRQIFSLSAPKHPENDKINITNPMDKMTTTGSSGIEVNSATSSKNPFSVQAHIPHVNKSNPSS